jgi:hypothetical protein
MKKFALAGLAVAMLAATPALAQGRAQTIGAPFGNHHYGLHEETAGGASGPGYESYAAEPAARGYRTAQPHSMADLYGATPIGPMSGPD